MSLKGLHSRIALGTVQFGLDYGISNRSGKTSPDEVSKILDVASASSIHLLDTAFSYGDSEPVLGEKHAQERFRITSKFPKISPGDNIRNYLQTSLKRLRTTKIYGYLAHDPDSFTVTPGLWEELCELKRESLVEKIGYSVYTVNQLRALLNSGFTPDIVQLPYNVFDRRFESEFSDLKELGIEVHVRSPFLQGLLFLKSKDLSIHFNPVKSRLDLLQTLLPNPSELAAALIMFCLQNTAVDYVVLGANDHMQLKQNMEALGGDNAKSELVDLAIEDESILLPYLWPRKGE